MKDKSYKYYLDKVTIILTYLSLLTASFSVLLPRDYHALPHIAMGTLIGCGVLRLFFFPLPDARQSLLNAVGPIGMYLVLIAGLYINSEPEWFRISYIKNHFVMAGLAIGMMLMPRFKTRNLILAAIPFSLFVIGIALISTYRYYNYDISASSNTEGLDVITNTFIPFSLWHHTLGIFITLAVLIIYYSWYFNRLHFHRVLQYGLWFLIGLLFVLQHYISARIGLLTTYAVLIYLVHLNLNKMKKVIFYAAFIFAGVLAYFTIDTFNNRVHTSLHDIVNPNYNEHGINNVSARLFALEAGWAIIKQKPWTGISYDIYDIDNKYFVDFYDNTKYAGWRLRPHNQFVFYAVLFGVPLALLFSFFFFWSFFINKNIRIPIILLFFFIIFSYCFTDMPLVIDEFYYPFSFLISFLVKIKQ